MRSIVGWRKTTASATGPRRAGLTAAKESLCRGADFAARAVPQFDQEGPRAGAGPAGGCLTRPRLRNPPLPRLFPRAGRRVARGSFPAAGRPCSATKAAGGPTLSRTPRGRAGPGPRGPAARPGAAGKCSCSPRRRNGENPKIERKPLSGRGFNFTGTARSKIGGNGEMPIAAAAAADFVIFSDFRQIDRRRKSRGENRRFPRGFCYLGFPGAIFSISCAAPSGNISSTGGRTCSASTSLPVGFQAFGGRPRPIGAGSARSRHPLSSSSAR